MLKFGEGVGVALTSGRNVADGVRRAIGLGQATRDFTSDLRVGVWSSPRALGIAAVDAASGDLVFCTIRQCPEKAQAAVLASVVGDQGLNGLPAFLVLGAEHYRTMLLNVPGLTDEELGQALSYRVQALVEQEPEGIAVAGQMIPPRSGVRGAVPMALAIAANQSNLDRLVYMAEAAGLKVQGAFARESVTCDVGRALDKGGLGVVIAHVAPDELVLTLTSGGVLRMVRHLALDEDLPWDAESRLNIIVAELQRSLDFIDRRLSSEPLKSLHLTPDSQHAEELARLLAPRLAVPAVRVFEIEDFVSDAANVAEDAPEAALYMKDSWLAVAAALPRHSDRNISVYQPPVKELQFLSPVSLLLGNVAMVFVFVLMTLVQSWMTGSAEERLAAARAEQRSLTSQLGELPTEEELEAREPSPELIEKLADTRWLRDFYESLLADFEAIDLGVAEGFSQPLLALGDVLVDGLWIESVRLDGDTALISGKSYRTMPASEFSRQINNAHAFRRWDLVELRVDDSADSAGSDSRYSARSFTLSGSSEEGGGRRSGQRLEGVPNRLFELLQDLRSG